LLTARCKVDPTLLLSQVQAFYPNDLASARAFVIKHLFKLLTAHKCTDVSMMLRDVTDLYTAKLGWLARAKARAVLKPHLLRLLLCRGTWPLPKLRDVLRETSTTDTTDFVVTILKTGTNLTDVLTSRGSVGVVEKVLGELHTAFVANKPALVKWLKHGNNLISLLTSQLSTPSVKNSLSSLMTVLGSQEAVVQFLLIEEHLIRILRNRVPGGLASRIQDVVKECPLGTSTSAFLATHVDTMLCLKKLSQPEIQQRIAAHPAPAATQGADPDKKRAAGAAEAPAAKRATRR
jgi:hypothetical protein